MIVVPVRRSVDNVMISNASFRNKRHISIRTTQDGNETEPTDYKAIAFLSKSSFKHAGPITHRSVSYFGLEVLTAVVMKSKIFWYVMQCSSLKDNWSFGGTYRLHFQGRIHRAWYQRDSWLIICFHAGILLGAFDPGDGDDVPPQRRFTFNGPHGVISQKIVLVVMLFCLAAKLECGTFSKLRSREPEKLTKRAQKILFLMYTNINILKTVTGASPRRVT
jgi:hypothetical protein